MLPASAAPRAGPIPVASTSARIGIPVILALALAGCAVGPQFRAPEVEESAGYRRDALPEATVSAPVATGDAQRFLETADLPTRWWANFASDELNRRVEQALTHSPSIASAQAALRQAQAGVDAARGSLFPSLDANLGANRQNGLDAGLADASPFTLYNAGVGVSYTLDLFGGVRRGVQAQSALADAQRHVLDGTYLSLAANVTTTSILEASLRAQIRATEEIAGLYAEQFELTRKQNEIGAKSRTDVLLAQSQLAAANAELPALRKALAQTHTQLAVYLGRYPSEVELAALELDGLTLPVDVPVSLPSTLVRARPDIRAAEAQWHEASARVGIATANLFPSITLSGSYGSQALSGGDLFVGGSQAWGLGLNLLQPIFRGGTLRAQKRAAEAGLDKAAADYRTTVLSAFQNVADALRALELDAEGLRAQAAAEEATRSSLDLVRVQYEEGATSYLQVIDATRLYQQSRIGLIQARAARLADTAALYAALGGSLRAASSARADDTPISN